ncbi:hypothetical protein IMG5_195900 [Ichthyophthirius multifiliis]|uniref:SURF1-like protein n=1 Tax=Ichthyophthirius multifiliis TaxID=5932 RepID=G0R506_ICHMU|nr:hypothetical protein IMG5_195900 [Ichthyophthirius multifiliis]EGR27408.1 hypothetical protein IMG5_195900 [Ichthyophthirius multifiliis]|eukprot:XP_004024318.1 hypothetical protein IMG5_195900 [Ichthyophthirius multifiliis]
MYLFNRINRLRYMLSNPAGQLFLGSIGIITAYNTFYHVTKYFNLNEQWKNVYKNLSNQEPYYLQGEEALIYPWLIDNNIKDWEFKQVRIRGYFKDERFFVRRKRDGKEGFLVFAPFVTAVKRLNHRPQIKEVLPVEHVIFVNIGWVALEHQKSVELGSEIAPQLDLDESQFYTDFYTQLNPNPENPNEKEQITMTEIQGIVRKGETENWLTGRRNWPQQSIFNWVDLDFMARFFRVFNLDSAKAAYIERVVSELEEESYPIPSTKENFDKPLITPQYHSQQLSLNIALSVLSFASILFLKR